MTTNEPLPYWGTKAKELVDNYVQIRIGEADGTLQQVVDEAMHRDIVEALIQRVAELEMENKVRDE